MPVSAGRGRGGRGCRAAVVLSKLSVPAGI